MPCCFISELVNLIFNLYRFRTHIISGSGHQLLQLPGFRFSGDKEGRGFTGTWEKPVLLINEYAAHQEIHRTMPIRHWRAFHGKLLWYRLTEGVFVSYPGPGGGEIRMILAESLCPVLTENWWPFLLWRELRLSLNAGAAAGFLKILQVSINWLKQQRVKTWYDKALWHRCAKVMSFLQWLPSVYRHVYSFKAPMRRMGMWRAYMYLCASHAASIDLQVMIISDGIYAVADGRRPIGLCLCIWVYTGSSAIVLSVYADFCLKFSLRKEKSTGCFVIFFTASGTANYQRFY